MSDVEIDGKKKGKCPLLLWRRRVHVTRVLIGRRNWQKKKEAISVLLSYLFFKELGGTRGFISMEYKLVFESRRIFSCENNALLLLILTKNNYSVIN